MARLAKKQYRLTVLGNPSAYRGPKTKTYTSLMQLKSAIRYVRESGFDYELHEGVVEWQPARADEVFETPTGPLVTIPVLEVKAGDYLWSCGMAWRVKVDVEPTKWSPDHVWVDTVEDNFRFPKDAKVEVILNG